MKTFNPYQKLLLSAEYLLDINPLKKYELLFDNLNPSPIETSFVSNGRPPIPKSSLLKALIYKNLKPFPTLYDLAVPQFAGLITRVYLSNVGYHQLLIHKYMWKDYLLSLRIHQINHYR